MPAIVLGAAGNAGRPRDSHGDQCFRITLLIEIRWGDVERLVTRKVLIDLGRAQVELRRLDELQIVPVARKDPDEKRRGPYGIKKPLLLLVGVGGEPGDDDSEVLLPTGDDDFLLGLSVIRKDPGQGEVREVGMAEIQVVLQEVDDVLLGQQGRLDHREAV